MCNLWQLTANRPSVCKPRWPSGIRFLTAVNLRNKEVFKNAVSQLHSRCTIHQTKCSDLGFRTRDLNFKLELSTQLHLVYLNRDSGRFQNNLPLPTCLPQQVPFSNLKSIWKKPFVFTAHMKEKCCNKLRMAHRIITVNWEKHWNILVMRKLSLNQNRNKKLIRN